MNCITLFGLVGGYTRATEDTFQLPRIEFLPLTNKHVAGREAVRRPALIKVVE